MIVHCHSAILSFELPEAVPHSTLLEMTIGAADAL
jgi:hypothetical protein